jgi:S1-C subfamily serine protease
VGKVSRVAIQLSNGLEVEGRVLSVNERRDVALIKAAIRIPRALPIRKEFAKRLEKVFVIGSPIDEFRRSTVTTGIVSTFRRNESGLILIQSDAAISPGSSGGPMLDENGNVLGISVSSSADKSAQNLNSFIPINDALRALKISLVKE